MRTIEGVKEMKSNGYEGGANVILKFDAGFDADKALDDVREALDDPKPSADQVTKALADLAYEGKVERHPPAKEGAKQGTRYRWRLSNFTSDGPSYIAEVKLEAAVDEEAARI